MAIQDSEARATLVRAALPEFSEPRMSSLLRGSLCLIAALVLTHDIAVGQRSIRESRDLQQWYLDAGESTYALGVNEQGMLQNLYWGPKLPSSTTLPRAQSFPERASFDPSINTTALEYPAWGAGLSTEPALKVDSPNGDRTLVLAYETSRVVDSTLELVLRDKVQPMCVHLFYRTYPEGVLERWARIENVGTKPFVIEQAASAVWNLPAGTEYNLSWLTGQWGGEWQLHTEPIAEGSRVIESRRGSTSHQANPWFAIGKAGETTEVAGPTWFGELGWSGSWRMAIEQTALKDVRITAGYNPFDFAWRLQAGENLETPHFYAGYTQGGQGEASRILHAFQLKELLPERPDGKPRPIVYNSWEATGFAVNEPGQMDLADKAARLGVERFVVDDGWFGQRITDKAGLGDWYVNQNKFPHGLKPLIDHVHARGMDFGLWVEPEMVNPESDLYRKHPDWVMSFPNRQRTEERNQLVLNLARADVKAYVLAFLDELVTKNDIAFLKWDYNRNWTEPGWPDVRPTKLGEPDIVAQKEIYVRYVQNLYDILAQLRGRHPHLEIESCSGGGGRVDLGILRYTDEVWPSDNTDALDRLTLQSGFTYAYAPEIMVAWVTDTPNFLDHRDIPLQFRFLVAMQGALGIGGNLNKWSPEDLDIGSRLTVFYKAIRSTIQHGRLYRLEGPQQNDVVEVEYVAGDGSQAVLLSYLHSQRYGMKQPRVHLQGLNPSAMYNVRALNPEKYAGEAQVSGAALMGEGVSLSLSGDYDSTALIIALAHTNDD